MHQVLFGLVRLFQQLQPAIAADAVRQMDDIVALAQLEKAVDGRGPVAAARADSDRRDETVRRR